MKTLIKLTIFSICIYTINGCSKNEFMVPNHSNKLKSSTGVYSSEEIFKALFFLQGDLAYKIKETAELKTELDKGFDKIDAAQKTKYQTFISKKIEDIKLIDPYFFSYFGENMKSGNPLLVREAMTKGGLLIQEVIFNDPEFKTIIEKAFKLVQNINIEQIKNADGSINRTKLNEVITMINGSYSISESTLSNFGMQGESTNNTNIAYCAVEVYQVYIYVAYVQSVAVGVNYAAAVNAVAAVNAWAYLNVDVWGAGLTKYRDFLWNGNVIVKSGGSGGGSGGGGGGEGTCGPSIVEPDNSGDVPNAMYIYSKGCSTNSSTSTIDDLYIMNITDALKVSM